MNLNDELEHDSEMTRLMSKVDSGEALAIYENYYFCDHIFDAGQYTICQDEYFKRMFLSKVKVFDAPERQEWSSFDWIKYEALVHHWEKIIHETTYKEPDQLLLITVSEIRKELRNLKLEDLRKLILLKPRQYQIDKFILFEWSKYRYIMIKRFFDETIKSSEYLLRLKGQEISLTYYSIVHIFTNHFGAMMKSYEHHKDHFDQDIDFHNIHLLLEDIFKSISNSPIILKDLRQISIRYKGKIYKIFNEYENKFRASNKHLRLNSFFPVSDKRMLEKLQSNHTETRINGTLSIFI